MKAIKNGLRSRQMQSHPSFTKNTEFDTAELEFTTNNSWEELLSSGFEARKQKDDGQWELGRLGNRVRDRYGTEGVRIYAANIGVNKKSLFRYMDVWNGWLGKERIEAMSFSHHKAALSHEDPEWILNQAYEGCWSVEKMVLEIKGHAQQQRPKSPHWCPKCMGWEVKNVCHCH